MKNLLTLALLVSCAPAMAQNAINLGVDRYGVPLTSASIGSNTFGSSGQIMFSSDVVITGDLEVQSAHSKAIWLPTGGIHLEGGTPTATVAPGQMFSKNIVASTITLQGSAILWKNSLGVVTSTFSDSGINLGSGSITGTIHSINRAAGPPAAANCNSNTIGTFFEDTSAPKLYYCQDSTIWGVVSMTNCAICP